MVNAADKQAIEQSGRTPVLEHDRFGNSRLYQQCSKLMGAAIDTMVGEHVDVSYVLTYKINQML